MRDDDKKRTLYQAENRFSRARGAVSSGQNLQRPEPTVETELPAKPVESVTEPEIPEWAGSRRWEQAPTPDGKSPLKPRRSKPSKSVKSSASKEWFSEVIIPEPEESESISEASINTVADIGANIDDTIFLEETGAELLEAIEALTAAENTGFDDDREYDAEVSGEEVAESVIESPVKNEGDRAEAKAEFSEKEDNTDVEAEENSRDEGKVKYNDPAALAEKYKTIPRFKKEDPIGEEASVLSRAGRKMQNVLATHAKRISPVPAKKPEPSANNINANTIEEAILLVSSKKDEIAAPVEAQPPVNRRSEAGRRRAMERAHKNQSSGSEWAIDESRYTESRPSLPQPELQRQTTARETAPQVKTHKQDFDQKAAETVNENLTKRESTIKYVPVKGADSPRSRQTDELQKNLGNAKRTWPHMETPPVRSDDIKQKNINVSRFVMPDAEAKPEKYSKARAEIRNQSGNGTSASVKPGAVKSSGGSEAEQNFARKARTRDSGQGGLNLQRSVKNSDSVPPKPQSRVWMVPVALILVGILLFGGYRGYIEYGNYMTYAEQKRLVLQMEEVVNVDTFYEGVTIDGRSVAGYSYEEVRNAFMERDQAAIDGFGITLAYGDRKFVIDSQIADYRFNTEEVVSKAYAMGRSSDLASLTSRYNEVMRIASEGADFTISSSYDISRVQEYVSQVANELYVAPVDAKVASFNESTKSFTFVDEKNGMSVDATGLYQQVAEALGENRLAAVFDIPTTVLSPSVKKATLEANFGLVSTFSTTTTADSKRNANIKLATSAINGTMLASGELFEFNKSTGERTPEKGYQEAGAIKNGVLIKEPGGGVCQVSSTLFVAAAQADLEIVYRTNHTWPSSYVAIGLDATVDWPGVDFTFRNSKSTPAFIYARFEGQNLTIQIYGAKLEPGLEIRLESESTGRTEPNPPITRVNQNLKPGESIVAREARAGHTATTYKVYYQNGVRQKSVKLCDSVYPPVQGIIEVGPKS